MITFDMFLFGLMVVSTITGFATQAVKKILSDLNKTCHPNILASIVSVVVSVFVGVGYVMFTNIAFTSQVIVCLVALAFGGWLCAMLGYDKIIGALKNTNKED